MANSSSPAPEPVKSGIFTSEFYIAVVTSIASISLALSHSLEPKYAVIAAALSSMAYSISRGLAKS